MAVLVGSKWGTSQTNGTSGGVVTWSITPAGTDITRFQGDGAQGSVSVDPASFISIDYQAVLRQAFDRWAAVSNIEFIQVVDQGGAAATASVMPDIRISFGLIDGVGGFADGFTYYPPPNGGYDGDMLLDITSWYNTVSTYFFRLVLHEIGHAIGLGHVNFAAAMNPNLPVNDLQADDITGAQTIYGVQDNGPNIYNMPVSLATITLLDGAANLTINGNSLDNTINGSPNGETINGAGGNDILSGGGGSDIIDGGTGNDQMAGGTGDDSFFVDSAGDTVTENAGEGTDTVNSSVDRVLGANLENLTLLTGATNGSGNGASNVITGNGVGNTLNGFGGNDTLIGNASNDILDGGTGVDIMSGGLNDDTYYVDDAGDTVNENAGEGTDTVNSSVDRVLGANLENLTLLTGATNGSGNGENNVITGNGVGNTLNGFGGNDTLIGNAGNDILDGGTGVDIMSGGLNDDTYYVDNAADAVNENSGEGTDTVNTTVSYTLPSNFETLVLVEGAAGAVSAAGNGVQNFLYGNSGSNTLFSYVGDDVLVGGGGNDIIDGGVGDDTMAGGAGNDTYYVDSQADTIMENAGEGSDTVFSTASFTLANEFEILFLIEGAAGAINGAGNSVANQIYGNSLGNALSGYGGADILVGGAGDDLINGGAGVDLMHGGADNDTFVFASGEANGDTVLDFAGNGAVVGDSFQFTGFGTAAQGASFTQVGVTNNWQIHSGLDAHNEIITLDNGASVHASDYVFV